MKILILSALTLCLAACVSASPARVNRALSSDPEATHESNTQTASDAINALAGTYTGHWDMYGLDKSGNRILVMSWDDTITLSDPKLGVDPLLGERRAYGKVTDVMEFRFPKGTPKMTADFTEGFKINADGSAGEHYFTFKSPAGQVSETVEKQVGVNRWSYESPVDVSSFSALGITRENVVEATTVTVKTVEIKNRTEIQEVTQVTRLAWKDQSGTNVTKSFVSMTGVHSRTLGAERQR